MSVDKRAFLTGATVSFVLAFGARGAYAADHGVHAPSMQRQPWKHSCGPSMVVHTHAPAPLHVPVSAQLAFD
jgi:hypothetical protein